MSLFLEDYRRENLQPDHFFLYGMYFPANAMENITTLLAVFVGYISSFILV